ncbi:MAG: hypothetical protein AB8H79_23640, partial [Myxococcota bacterium]
MGSCQDGSSIGDGALIRLHEGAGGIDTLEALGADLIAATDLDDLIPSPVFYDRDRTCTWFGCITWYEVGLYVNNPSIGAVRLNLDPRSNGTIRTSLSVDNIRLNWRASGKLVGIGYSGSGRITASRMTVGMDLRPRVERGDIKVGVSNVGVSTSGFNFQFNGFGWLEDVLDFFGYNVDNEIRKLVEGSLRDAARDQVPPAVEDLLQDLELATDIEVLGATTAIEAEPAAVDVDDKGITLRLAASASPGTWTS